jgi:hypothetical protein
MLHHNPTPIINLSLVNKSLSLTISWEILVLIILLVIIYFIYRWIKNESFGSDFEIDKAEVGIGSGKISFKPNKDDQQIAYAIWIELSTRKIGVPIDLKHDVIYEIYDSWYNFFSITRELIKDIPVSKVKNNSTQKIINLSIDILNNGLRPHLTSWQARFRYWYEKELKKEENIDPQTIQESYPKFDELKEDLLTVNNRLIKYREKMKEIVLGTSKD